MTSIHFRLSVWPTVIAASIIVSGCRSSADVSTGPARLIVVAGADQQATVGTGLAISPVIRVQDAGGAAVSAVTVHFTVVGGGGTVIGDSALTDVSGRVAVGQWVLGTTPGTNTLRAEIAGTTTMSAVATLVTATAVPGVAVGIRASGQPGFLALVGQAVAPLPAVLVVDSYGNPVPGTVVTFTLLTGGGSIQGGTAVADAAGVARPGSWTLGLAVGSNSLQARIPTGASATFSAQALDAAPHLQSSSTISQAGYLQFQVTNIPRVEVLDSTGRALIGVPVTFVVSSGDGVVTGGIAVTGTDGVASPADWRLGLTSGSVTATVGLGATPIVFNATGVGAPFLIDLRFLTTVNADQRDAFVAAARRWMAIISAHLTPVPLNLPAGACTALQPAMNETVRDVVIFAEVIPIDGVGNVLGSASPCASRSSSGLTIVGTMQFDSADLPALVTTNQLVPSITHEMGHVLGFGTLWSSRALVTGLGGNDPRFIGTEAQQVWPPFAAALGFVGATVPVENLFGAGTAGVHWRESIFHAELMTGFIEAPGVFMPLSKVTIAAMKDLGYEVDYSSADLFVGHIIARGATLAPPTMINERIGTARFEFTPQGVMRPIH